jgi:hypothetical protein
LFYFFYGSAGFAYRRSSLADTFGINITYTHLY